MTNIEKIDNELYGSIYGIPRKGNADEIWSKIVSNPEILREAVKVIRDKFNEHDIVKGLTIADQMLIFYDSVDKVAYNNLINSIYTNEDIARIVMDGASNGGFSYLLMSLWNHDLKLTKEQKEFAVNEAMNKIGTTRDKAKKDAFSKKLDKMGINNDNTTTLEFSGSKNPIGQKTGSMYMNNLFSSLSRTQAHGSGDFDIRYHILRNPNWTLEEKQQLIMDFWYDDDEYDETLEQWEWDIINDQENWNKETYMTYIDKYEMYEWTYEMLLKVFKDKNKTNEIYEEINFCKQMHKLRPQQWELDKPYEKVLKPTMAKK